MLKKSGGFTIPELLLSSVVMVLVFAATIIVYSMLGRIWREDMVLNDLVRGTHIAVDKMTRGLHGNEGLLAAKSITSPATGSSSSSVQYTDYNGFSRTFYYSNNKLYADSGNEILSDVLSATFYNMNSSALQIDLVTHKYVLDKEIKFHTQTNVKIRNE